ncbi:hypothetical protein ACVJH7_003134 [Bradyrhizobium elkanii]
MMARKPLGQIVVGLLQQTIQRQIKIDAAGIAGHAAVEAAEQPPQRQRCPPRLEVPQRDVERGQRQHRRPAAAAIMQRPPHLVPKLLGVVGLHPARDLADFAAQDIGDGAAIAADRVGVAGAFRAVGIAGADRDELERLDLAMRAVAQHHRERDLVESDAEVLEDGHAGTPCHGRMQCAAHDPRSACRPQPCASECLP